jgi:superfamily I DNA/RNA helicase
MARKHIPYRTVGGSSFFKRKTTRDILAYLALVDGMRIYHEYLQARTGPHVPKWDDIFTPVHCGEQNAAFRLVANIPSQEYFARTGKTSHRFTPSFYSSLTAFAAGRPLLQFCEEQAYTIAKEHQLAVKDLVSLIKRIWEGCHNHPAKAIKLIRQYAYDLHLRHRDIKHKEDQEEDAEAPGNNEETQLEERYEELEELERIAQHSSTIRHFLRSMARLKEMAEDTSKNKRDCVSLMTIHKSKGLENSVVFVMGLTEGIFPHRRSFTMAEDGPIVTQGMAEERRLAYVAFTRAQKQLFLTSILRYRGAEAVVSRFVQEAGLTPKDEDEALNPYLFHRDGTPKRLSSLVTEATLFEQAQ